MSAKSATSRAGKPSRKPATGSKAAIAKSKTGKLPEWNLADLYSGIDAPEVTRDLQKMDAECVAFETDYKGKLAEHVAGDDGGQLARRGGQALRGDRRSRRPARLLCRPRSCRRQRRSGDLQVLRRRFRAADGRLGASAVLRTRTQPHRRCRDRARDADAGARPLPAVDRGSAQGQAVSARGSRRAVVSRKIPERLCRLEPAVRPDHLRPALQGRGQGTGDRADAQPAAGPRAGKAQGRRAGAGEDLQGQ